MYKGIEEYLLDNYKHILDLLNDGIIITDKDGIVHYINPAYTLYSGIKYKDIVGKYIGDIRPGAILPQVLETLKPINNIFRKFNDTESYCDYIPITYDNVLVGGLIIVKDVVRVKDLLSQIKESNKRINQLDVRVKETFKANYTFNDIIGEKNGLKETVDLAKKAAISDSTILLIGESGTGKELFAQSIHNYSNRKDMPFVAINCAALPDNLLESELFGYEEGAFTGAKKGGKLGLFELANGGTIFLDEVTEVPLKLQAKLLRAIQEKRIMRIGSEKNIDLNVRIISATNKNIIDLIKENIFREDLYFRLAVFVIDIPPLRERKEDIQLLANYFIENEIRKTKKVINIDDEAMNALKLYHWPGNIREFKNAIEYSCNVTDDNIITTNDLPQNVLKKINIDKLIQKNINDNLKKIITKVEKSVIEDYLNRYGNTVDAKNKIAKDLDISIATLYNKIRRYNL
ncbi:MAG: sigma 54-interacting transcriptional regulator [Tissierellia bacterium]|nr:sigma 54-interacting transcriptional regulator [Tissierellia bacterium]